MASSFHLDSLLLNKLRCLSVVMPVYNEAVTFRQILRRVLSVPLPMEVIVIDDFSTDGTRDLIKSIQQNETAELSREFPHARLKFLFHDKNQGKGAALRTGIEQATGDLLIVQDADFEYEPNEYGRLIEPILAGDADVVFGSRFRGERSRVLLFWHTVGNRFLTLLSNLFTNLNLTDMETCYKVFKTDIIKSLPLRSNRFGFEPEITAKVAKLRCVIYEVPISYKGRTYAEGKKINWKDGISAVWTILKFWLMDDLYKDGGSLRALRVLQGAGRYNQWLFQQCRPFLGERVLEIGSGVGNITKFLLDRKLTVATDVVDYYLTELKRAFEKYSNVAVRRLDLLDEPSVRRFSNEFNVDTVLTINTIERISEDETALQNINRLLPSGGRLVLLVPAHQRLFCAMDRYLGYHRRYDKQGLRALLEKNGFLIEKIDYLNALGALAWFVNGHLLRRSFPPTRQIRLFDGLTPLIHAERFMGPPFGLSVLGIAKKTREV